MIMVNSTMVKINTLVTVPKTAQKKMIVLGVPGVHGLNVLYHVGLEKKPELELFSRRLNLMAINVLMRLNLKPKHAKWILVQSVNGMNGPTGINVKEVSGGDIEMEMRLVPKIMEFKQNPVLQLIASGANGVVGVPAPKTVVMEYNAERDPKCNLQPMEVLHVKGNLLKQDTAKRHHAIVHLKSIVSGANGVNGAPKLMELDFKKGTAKYHNMLRMEDNCVVDNLVKQRSA